VPEPAVFGATAGLSFEAEVAAVVAARIAAIDAEEQWSATHAQDEIGTRGPCQRPTLAEREALTARAMAWVKLKHARLAATLEGMSFGCIEADGSSILVVSVERPTPEHGGGDGSPDPEAPENRTHFSWTLRARPGAIEALFPYATRTLVVVDGDGIRDAVGLSQKRGGDWELGGIPEVDCEVLVSGRKAWKSVATYQNNSDCGFTMKRSIAPDGGSIPVMAIWLATQSLLIHRCFAGTGPWVDCAAAQVLTLRERGRRALESPHLDRESIAEALTLLGVDPAVRDPLIARAKPSTACEELALVNARLGAVDSELSADATVANQETRGQATADNITASLGLTQCGTPTRAQVRQLEAKARQLRQADLRTAASLIPLCKSGVCRPYVADRLGVSDVCVGPSGTTWVTTWHLDGSDKRSGDDEDYALVVRSLLVHSKGGTAHVLAGTSAAVTQFSSACPSCTSSPLITTKSRIAGGSVIGLVALAGDPQLHIAIDGQLTAVSEVAAPADIWTDPGGGLQFTADFHISRYEEGWRWPWRAPNTLPFSVVTMEKSPLLRAVTGEGDEAHVAFWYPTATGLKLATAFTMPKLGERAKVALEGTVSPELQASLVASERRGLEPKDEGGCAELLELLRP